MKKYKGYELLDLLESGTEEGNKLLDEEFVKT